MSCKKQRGQGGSGAMFAVLLGIACYLTSPPGLRAQAPDDSVAELRQEINQLREEMKAMRDEMRQMRSNVSPATAGTVSSVPPATSEATFRDTVFRGASPSARTASTQDVPQETSTTAKLEMIQAQIAEHAQTKVESNSRLPVKIFGTILSQTFWNSHSANWLDLPNMAMPDSPASLPGGSFSSTLRQSSFGTILEGPTIGSMKSSAFVSLDFYAGIPGFETGQVMGLPRLVYAYAQLDGERTAFEAGQDQMILAPKNPTTIASQSFPDLYNSGNLYLRAPLVRAERVLAARPGARWS